MNEPPGPMPGRQEQPADPLDEPPTDKAPADKAGWRVRLRIARAAVPADQRAHEAQSLAAAVVAAARTLLPSPGQPGTGAAPLCCYVPVGYEPGSARMLDALREAGYEVLLPVVVTESGTAGAASQPRPAPLDWAPYRGATSLGVGPFGLREPTTARQGISAVGRAGLVLVPALAVDHRGVRLGKGGGWYDRSLALTRPGTPLLAVVRDEELVSRLPAEPHDVRMTGVLTPSAGLRALPLRLD